MIARAVTTHQTSQRLPSALQAKIVDNPLPIMEPDWFAPVAHADPNDIPDGFDERPASPFSVRVVSSDDRLPLDGRNIEFLDEFRHGVEHSRITREARVAKSKLRQRSRPKDASDAVRARAYASKLARDRRDVADRMVIFRKGRIAEHGLRSWTENSPSLKRWVQILPKVVECGDGKGVVYREKKKIVALDRKRVTLDKRRLGALIIDLDKIFQSEWALREELLKLLPETMLPNFIVGETTEAGDIIKPHLIWLLPPGYEVWENNEKTVKLCHSIHRRLIQRLLPLGADPGQLANPYKAKNPCSPHWTTCILTERWNTLAEMTEVLSKEVSAGQIKREVAKLAGHLQTTGSCAYWHHIWTIISTVMKSAHSAKDPAYLAAVRDPPARFRWLRQAVIDAATDLLGTPNGAELDIISMRTEFAARKWDPDYVDCNRGRDAEEIYAKEAAAGGKLSETECRQVAQARTKRDEHEAKMDIIARAVAEIVPDGADPWKYRPAVVARCKGFVGQSMVYAKFGEAIGRAVIISATVHRYIATMGVDSIAQSQAALDDRLVALVLPNSSSSVTCLDQSDVRGLVAETPNDALRRLELEPRSKDGIGETEILLPSSSAVASCRQSSENPVYGQDSSASCPPSSGGTLQGGSSVDPSRDGAGLQRRVSRKTREVRNAGSSSGRGAKGD